MKTFLRITFFFFLVTQICFGQWVQTNGPYGGLITCLKASGTNLFAGTIDGVYLSTNNGLSWKDINEGLPRQIFDDTTKYVGIGCLALIGQNLFVGTLGGGVFLSTNNGTNWNEVNSGLPTYYSGDIDVKSFAVIGSRLFAATNSGVFLSTNNGTHWTKVSSGPPIDVYASSLAAIDSNLFAGSSEGVFLTTDYGVSWHSVLNKDINILAANGTNLFAGSWGGVRSSLSFHQSRNKLGYSRFRIINWHSSSCLH
jgi:ligand-binding sensor domain-containing protein